MAYSYSTVLPFPVTVVVIAALICCGALDRRLDSSRVVWRIWVGIEPVFRISAERRWPGRAQEINGELSYDGPLSSCYIRDRWMHKRGGGAWEVGSGGEENDDPLQSRLSEFAVFGVPSTFTREGALVASYACLYYTWHTPTNHASLNTGSIGARANEHMSMKKRQRFLAAQTARSGRGVAPNSPT